MNTLIQFLNEHGLMLLSGSTMLLLAGACAMCLHRSPVHRQRIGECTIACTLVWLMLACIPMRRWSKPTHSDGPAIPTGRFDSQPSDSFSPSTALPNSVAQSKEDGTRSVPATVVGTRSRAVANSAPFRVPSFPGPALSINAGKPQKSIRLALAAMTKNDFVRPTVAVYFAGVSACLAWLLLGHVLLWKLLRSGTRPDALVAGLFNEVASEFNLRNVRLVVCRRPNRPFSFGIWQRTVVIDRQTAANQSAARLRQILRHELTHIRRRDAWGNALFNFAMVGLYFHPLYWWLRSRSFLAREMVADDVAASASGHVAYASDLLALARTCAAPRPKLLAPIGMFHFTTNLSRRITMLVQPHAAWEPRCSRFWRLNCLAGSAMAVAILVLTLGVHPARAQETRSGDDQQKLSDDEAAVKQRAEELGQREESQKRQEAQLLQLQTQLLQLEAQRAQLEVQLKATQDQLAAIQNQRSDLDSKRREMKETSPQQATSNQRIESSMAQVEEQQAQLDKDRLDLKRKQQLLEKGALSNYDLEQSEIQIRLDEAKLAHAKNDLDRAKEETAAQGYSSVAPPSVRGELDLVALANSYSNALSELRLARANLQGTGPANVTVKVEAENAASRFELLRHIVEIAAEHAHAEAQRSQELYRRGALSAGELEPILAKVKILNTILQTRPDTPADQKPQQ